MRRDKVFRFVATTFVVGAFIGLICGLAFGGSGQTGTARASSDDGNSASSTEAPSDDTATPDEPMTEDRARAIGANEMGQVLVVMYHHFDVEESEWTRTAENFRSDIALLKEEGYYPINLRDLASGNIDIPAGKSPVVLTFDDSSPGQYRILDDGSVDPDCAVGIMQSAVEAGGWASRGTFFPLLDVTPKERVLWGQAERKQEKLRNLIDWGYEVGSQTITHLNLGEASTKDATWQLAESQATLEELIGGGYQVTSLALPFGEYPSSDDVIRSGKYEEITYSYLAAVSVVGRPSQSPFSAGFDPLHIPRVRGSENFMTDVIQTFKDHPELRYISDGDPTTVSAPKDLPESLGQMSDDLGRPVIRY